MVSLAKETYFAWHLLNLKFVVKSVYMSLLSGPNIFLVNQQVSVIVELWTWQLKLYKIDTKENVS